jgi:hypothetical protein
VHGEQREALLTLSRQAKERGWWQSYVSAIPEWFQVYVGLEAEASTVHLYESELVDGLLQTPGYYRTFLRAAPAAAGENEAERKIEVRLARQERLTSDDPPEYWAVLNEAVIRRGRATGAWTATRGGRVAWAYLTVRQTEARPDSAAYGEFYGACQRR